MQAGDVVNILLKTENTPRLNVQIFGLTEDQLLISETGGFDWADIDDIETISYRPTFTDGTRVHFQDKEYVRHQNKWYMVTNYNDGHVASAVEAGNATILGQ